MILPEFASLLKCANFELKLRWGNPVGSKMCKYSAGTMCKPSASLTSAESVDRSQKQLLLNSTVVCLDATHCVSHIQRGIIHRIVARHPATGAGCPVAYMFTEDRSMATVSVFLSFVKNDIWITTLEKITIDVSTIEHAAITAVYPEAAVQWCLFHVSRAWMRKIRELIKLESLALNNQVHRAIITDLKALMWKKNRLHGEKLS
ncbi:hypothetical protein G6F57_016327 [Rhizopus arrhizus]|nr:hypothetical protein G6F57_016327 [Rhizopus arrhizus]